MQAYFIILFLVGIIVLIVSSAALARGTLRMAGHRSTHAGTLALTVVALGSALPELTINLLSAHRGFPALALGAVIGSNIVNILLVLGIAAIVTPIAVRQRNARQNIPFLITATLILTVLSLDVPLRSGSVNFLSMGDGIVLLALFLLFVYYQIIQPKEDSVDVSESCQPVSKKSRSRGLLLIFGGLVGIATSGWIAVEMAIRIIYAMNLPQSLMGLLFVAFVTALPEITTAALSARYGRPELLVGSLVGSSSLNILLVLGLTATTAGIPLYGFAPLDMLLLLLATLILLLMVLRGSGRRVDRIEGIILVTLYVGFALYVFFRSDVPPRVMF